VQANSVAGPKSRASEIAARLDRPLPSFGDSAPVPLNAGKARFESVTPITIDRYAAAVRDFFSWASSRRSIRNANDDLIDQLLCQYFDVLLRDACHPRVGRYTLFGYLMFYPRTDLRKQNRLCMARDALAGWSKRLPGSSRHPWPISVFYLVMHSLLKARALEAAVALLIQFDAYLRPSEVCSLCWSSVASPQPGLGTVYASKWAVIIGNTDLQERTKTGQSDDTIILGSPGREWVPTVLKLWKARHARVSPDEPALFPSLSLGVYEKTFSDAHLFHPR
jgi:hypothetical protein